MLSGEWRCSWSNADRQCSNYIWVINNLIAYQNAPYIRDLAVTNVYEVVWQTGKQERNSSCVDMQSKESNKNSVGRTHSIYHFHTSNIQQEKHTPIINAIVVSQHYSPNKIKFFLVSTTAQAWRKMIFNDSLIGKTYRFLCKKSISCSINILSIAPVYWLLNTCYQMLLFASNMNPYSHKTYLCITDKYENAYLSYICLHTYVTTPYPGYIWYRICRVAFY